MLVHGGVGMGWQENHADGCSLAQRATGRKGGLSWLQLAVPLGLAYCVLGSAVASATSWSYVTTADAPGADHSILSDIDCEPASTGTCVAAGQRTTAGTDAPFANLWNGRAWAAQTLVVPAGTTTSDLRAGSCSSATSCTVVGFYRTSAGVFTLAEAWNGSTWSVQSTPTPAGATDVRLNGLSCSAASACTSVGYSVVSSTRSAVVQRWNGSTWTAQSFPTPAGATGAELESVDCRSATWCVAVGRYHERSGLYKALSGTWNGSAWSLQTVANPSGTTKSILLDVSCAAVSRCVAVGAFTDGSAVQRTLAARWDGSAWTPQSTPNPAGSTNSVLQSVSCTGENTCIAAGDWLNRRWMPLAEGWNGLSWSIEPTPNATTGPFEILDGVACRGSSCLAVGFEEDSGGRNSTIGAVRDPSWTVEPAPLPSGVTGTFLDAVSCFDNSGNTCIAVGTAYRPSFAYSGNAQISGPGGTSNIAALEVASADLQGVSCISGPFCVVIGTTPGAHHWDGSTWSVRTIPSLTSRDLYDVSCTSNSACTATGSFSGTTIETESLAIRWDGSNWTKQSTPNPGDYQNELFGVSCATATFCMAVGRKRNGNEGWGRPFAASWNGSAWTNLSTPLPAGVTEAVARAVSCTSASACTAVGWYTGATSSQPLVMRWNGTAWSLQTVTLPGAMTSGTLDGVSCTSSSYCMAAGSSFASGIGTMTMAQRWDGSSWTAEAPLNPAPSSNDFFDVSCISSTWCTAVGDHYPSSTGARTKLVQRYDG